MTNSKRFWVVEGYDSINRIFSEIYPLGLFSVRQMEAAIQAMTAKAGLEFDEIMASYARKRSRIRVDHLAVHRQFRPLILTCGSNPHFAARIVVE